VTRLDPVQHKVRVTRTEALRLQRKARRLWPDCQTAIFGPALSRDKRMTVTLVVWPKD
jgi:hypothetical protein